MRLSDFGEGYIDFSGEESVVPDGFVKALEEGGSFWGR